LNERSIPYTICTQKAQQEYENVTLTTMKCKEYWNTVKQGRNTANKQGRNTANLGEQFLVTSQLYELLAGQTLA